MDGVANAIQLLADIGVLPYILTFAALSLAAVLWRRFRMGGSNPSASYHVESLSEKQYQRMMGSIENYDFSKVKVAPFPMEDDENLFD